MCVFVGGGGTIGQTFFFVTKEKCVTNCDKWEVERVVVMVMVVVKLEKNGFARGHIPN
jgi:hypothetical protein